MFSFWMSLIVSAIVCSSPWGPTCLGPIRLWIHPLIFRSKRTPNIAATMATPEKMTMVPTMARSSSRYQGMRATRRVLRPLQRALAPCIDQAEREDDQEYKDLVKGECPQPAGDHRPGVQVNDLHIKDHEDEGKQVVANVELGPRLPNRGHAGFVGLELLRIGASR